MSSIGRSPEEAGYLPILRSIDDTRRVVFSLLADQRLDALVYATFDHPPAVIGPGDMTDPSLETTGIGSNRRLSPILGLSCDDGPRPGLRAMGCLSGSRFLARPFDEPILSDSHTPTSRVRGNRRPPTSTPPLRGEP